MRSKSSILFRMESNTYIYFALLLFFVPLRWLVAWFVAVTVHELFHYAAVRFLGGDVVSFTLGIGGANMNCDGLSDWRLFCAILAGPLFGFLPAFLGQWFPRVAVCCWVLTVYNLFPLLPLDGGRALQILLRDSKCFCVVQYVVLFLLAVIAMWSAFAFHIGALPLAIVVGLWLKNRKRPCNESVCKVQ